MFIIVGSKRMVFFVEKVALPQVELEARLLNGLKPFLEVGQGKLAACTRRSCRQTIQRFCGTWANTYSISSSKVAEALQWPNSITLNCHSHRSIGNAVLVCLWPVKPLQRSMLLAQLYPVIQSRMSSMFRRGQMSFRMLSFNCQKLTQNCQSLSFFLCSTTVAALGLFEGSVMLASSISLIFFSVAAQLEKGRRQGCKLTGLLSPVLKLYWTRLMTKHS